MVNRVLSVLVALSLRSINHVDLISSGGGKSAFVAGAFADTFVDESSDVRTTVDASDASGIQTNTGLQTHLIRAAQAKYIK